MYFSPSSGSYALGSTISISVYSNSSDQPMNAASGAVSFPADKLQVESLSKSGSFISLWVQEPSYSNQSGKVNFEGIVLNPGYVGSKGKILTINFKVKAAGEASLGISSGLILANAGQGTNILSGSGSASLKLGEGKPVPPLPPPPPEITGKPAAPKVLSTTHEKSERWYAFRDAKFSWALPEKVTKARLLIDTDPLSSPSVIYSPAVSEKEVADLEDGVWYFHAQLYNKNGWGETTHFRFQVDTEKPTRFNISSSDSVSDLSPRKKFIFDAQDKPSGIDYYEVRVDNKEAEIWRDDGKHEYEASVIDPGDHILVVKAVDFAGNYLVDSVQFTVDALNPPIISEYAKKLKVGEPLVIKGETYPDSRVIVWLQNGANTPISRMVLSDGQGQFIFSPTEELKEGQYRFWAEAITKNEARTQASDLLGFSIYQPQLFKVGSVAVNVLAVIIPLLAMVVFLGTMLYLIWHKSKAVQKQMKMKFIDSGLTLRAFELLRVDIGKDIKLLERTKMRRILTQEEQAILIQLKTDWEAVNKISPTNAVEFKTPTQKM